MNRRQQLKKLHKEKVKLKKDKFKPNDKHNNSNF